MRCFHIRLHPGSFLLPCIIHCAIPLQFRLFTRGVNRTRFEVPACIVVCRMWKKADLPQCQALFLNRFGFSLLPAAIASLPSGLQGRDENLFEQGSAKIQPAGCRPPSNSFKLKPFDTFCTYGQFPDNHFFTFDFFHEKSWKMF